MPTVARAASLSAIFNSPLPCLAPRLHAFAAVHSSASRPFCSPSAARKNLPCQASLTTDLLSAFYPEDVMSKVETACMNGARIRVKVPIKIFHVMKVPELELCGMEGVIKQYVGIFKGKRVSASLRFKVEFILQAEGSEKPIKFFAHLKEDEFEIL